MYSQAKKPLSGFHVEGLDGSNQAEARLFQ